MACACRPRVFTRTVTWQVVDWSLPTVSRCGAPALSSRPIVDLPPTASSLSDRFSHIRQELRGCVRSSVSVVAPNNTLKKIGLHRGQSSQVAKFPSMMPLLCTQSIRVMGTASLLYYPLLTMGILSRLINRRTFDVHPGWVPSRPVPQFNPCPDQNYDRIALGNGIPMLAVIMRNEGRKIPVS